MMDKSKIHFGLITGFVLVAITYIFRLGGSYHQLLTNVIYLFPPLLAVWWGVLAARMYGDMTNIHARAIYSLTIGIAFLLTGECLWFFYRFILNVDPYPSLADLFYVLAYPFLFMGIMAELIANNSMVKRINLRIVLLITFLATVLSITTYHFNIYLAYDKASSLLENLVAMSYGVGDYVLITPCLFVLLVAFIYKGGKLFYSWLAVFLGLIFMFLGDISFAIYRDFYEITLWPYTLIDLLWIASYLWFAYGFWLLRANIWQAQQKLRKM